MSNRYSSECSGAWYFRSSLDPSNSRPLAASSTPFAPAICPANSSHECGRGCSGARSLHVPLMTAADITFFTGFREHLHQCCRVADAQRSEQARRWRHRPRGEEGEHPLFPTQQIFRANHRRLWNCIMGHLLSATSTRRGWQEGLYVTGTHADPRSTSRLRWTTSSPCSDDT